MALFLKIPIPITNPGGTKGRDILSRALQNSNFEVGVSEVTLAFAIEHFKSLKSPKDASGSLLVPSYSWSSCFNTALQHDSPCIKFEQLMTVWLISLLQFYLARRTKDSSLMCNALWTLRYARLVVLPSWKTKPLYVPFNEFNVPSYEPLELLFGMLARVYVSRAETEGELMRESKVYRKICYLWQFDANCRVDAVVVQEAMRTAFVQQFVALVKIGTSRVIPALQKLANEVRSWGLGDLLAKVTEKLAKLEEDKREGGLYTLSDNQAYVPTVDETFSPIGLEQHNFYEEQDWFSNT